MLKHNDCFSAPQEAIFGRRGVVTAFGLLVSLTGYTSIGSSDEASISSCLITKPGRKQGYPQGLIQRGMLELS